MRPAEIASAAGYLPHDAQLVRTIVSPSCGSYVVRSVCPSVDGSLLGAGSQRCSRLAQVARRRWNTPPAPSVPGVAIGETRPDVYRVLS